MNGPKTTLLDPTGQLSDAGWARAQHTDTDMLDLSSYVCFLFFCRCFVHFPGSTPPRDFTFDYSYWSFDSAAPNFATNPKVYSDLGVSVLNNAWSGYNCCLFAYGQTGSGKCWAPGTKLMMHSGSLQPVETIRENDLLMGDDSTPRRVLPGSVIKGQGPMYRIDHPSGRRDSWSVNGQHILVVALTTKPYITEEANTQRWAVHGYELPTDTNVPKEAILSTHTSLASAEVACRAYGPLTFEVSVEDYLTFPSDLKSQLSMFQPRLVEFPQGEEGRDEFRSHFSSDADAIERAWTIGAQFGASNIDSSILTSTLAIRRATLAGVLDAHRSNEIRIDSCKVDLVESIYHLARGVGCIVDTIKVEGDAEVTLRVSGSALKDVAAFTRHATLDTSAADIDSELYESFVVSRTADGPYHGFMVSGNARLLMGDYIVSHNSYSMVGYGEDKGIVPQAMDEMFRRISQNKDKNVKFMVEASMMEIYNEKVRDLFNPDSDKGNINGLKVRDNPQTGPYVEDLSRCLIKSYEEFSNLLADGNAVRTVAATQMNATSSRAHTVFQIVFTKTTHDEETNKSSAMTSKINLGQYTHAA